MPGPDPIDGIIVPAGGMTAEGAVPEWSLRRLDEAVHVWKATRAPILCSGGGKRVRAVSP